MHFPSLPRDAREFFMHGGGLGLGVLAVLVVGPLALWLARKLSREQPAAAGSFDLGLLVTSTLLYALAFNLTYFLQELFLVIPKALTPGLNPTLFHNNHTWAGDDPIARLYQGAGALAIFISGVLFLALARLFPRGAPRLFALWMAYHGLIQSLPQLPTAVLAPNSDVGQALTYLQVSPELSLAVGLLGLVAIPLAALMLTPLALEQAHGPERLATGRARTAFMLNLAALPALLGAVLIVPFRWPTEMPAIIIMPLMIGWFGVSWMVASAWLYKAVAPHGAAVRASWIAALALVALLIIFHLVLAPGVAFY